MWIIALILTPLAKHAFATNKLIDDVHQFEQLCEQTQTAYKIPGAAIALVQDGEITWTASFGLADKANALPISSDTIFQVASISKSVTAWGVMHLVDEGIVDLDAPASNYLTRWHLPTSEYKLEGVTIRRLLSHTSGLSLHGYPGFKPNQTLPSLEDSLSGTTGGAGDVRIINEPGTLWKYSGGGYTLLQLIIEEVTGESFATYMKHNVLEPLGMNDSYFEWNETFKAQMAKPYDFWGKELPNYLFTAKAAAGLYTTATDLARFTTTVMTSKKGTLHGSQVLHPETVSQMLTAQPATEGKFGLGYFLDAPPPSIPSLHHAGANEGWKAKFIAQPQTRDGIVILTNSDRGNFFIREIERVWLAWVNHTTPAKIDPLTDIYITQGIAILLGLLWVVYTWRKADFLKKGKIAFSSNLSRRNWIKLIIITVCAVVWWVGLYTGIMFIKYLPASFSWVTLTITLWCLTGIITCFFVKPISYSKN